jgi:multiple sugar transport system permease protein
LTTGNPKQGNRQFQFDGNQANMVMKKGLWLRWNAWFDKHFFIILPTVSVTFITLLLAFPFAYTLYMSLQKYKIGIVTPSFIGLSNFFDILGDTRFWNSLGVTAYFTGFAVIVELGLGLIMALFLNRNYIGKGLVRTVLVFSMSATPVAVALVWTLMFNPTLGVLNFFLEQIGLPPNLWTSSPNTVIPALAIVDIWQWTPFVFLVIQAALQSLPEEPFESARIDGATSLQSLFYITLPLIRPAIIVALMFRLIDCIKTFDIIYVITGGGPGIASENLNIYTFKQGFVFFNLGYGSALLIVLFLVVLLAVFIMMKIRRKG